MANDFRSIVPDTRGLTCANVFARWIDAGCQLEEEKKPALMLQRPPYEAPPPRRRIYRRKDGKIWGMGTPH